MKVLIIGSTGFLGSELLHLLINKNIDVQIMNRSYDDRFNGKQYLISDILNIENCFDVVCFLAAYVPLEGSEPKQDTNVNIKLASDVFMSFKNTKVIYSSSVSVYGNGGYDVFTEHEIPRPYTEYAKSKRIGEEIISECERFLILRFSSLYGSGMKHKTFITNAIQSAISYRYINLYHPDRLQDYLYISDAAYMIYEAILSSKIGIFNAVNGTSRTNKEVINIISTNIDDVIINDFGGQSMSFNYSRDLWNNNFSNIVTRLEDGLAMTIAAKR